MGGGGKGRARQGRDYRGNENGVERCGMGWNGNIKVGG